MDCVIRIIVPSLNILLGLTTLSLQVRRLTRIWWSKEMFNFLFILDRHLRHMDRSEGQSSQLFLGYGLFRHLGRGHYSPHFPLDPRQLVCYANYNQKIAIKKRDGIRLTEKRAIQCLTGLGALSGVVMVGLYSWALDQYLNSNFGRMNVSCGQIRNLYRVQACKSFAALRSQMIHFHSFILILKATS